MTEPPTKRLRRSPSPLRSSKPHQRARSPTSRPYNDRPPQDTRYHRSRSRHRVDHRDRRSRSRSYSRDRDRRRDRYRDDERSRSRSRDRRRDERRRRPPRDDRHRSRSPPLRDHDRTRRHRTRTPPSHTHHKPRQRSRTRSRSPRQRPPSDLPSGPRSSLPDPPKRSASKTNGNAPGGPSNGTIPPSSTTNPQSSQMDLDDDSDPETTALRKMMGFAGFKSTKNTKVRGNDVSGVRREKKTEYRQYMNRVGGFNRPLSPGRG